MEYWNKGESRTVKTLRTAAAPWQRISDDMKPVTLSGYTVVAPTSSRCVANQRPSRGEIALWSVHSYEVGLWKWMVIRFICIRYTPESNRVIQGVFIYFFSAVFLGHIGPWNSPCPRFIFSLLSFLPRSSFTITDLICFHIIFAFEMVSRRNRLHNYEQKHTMTLTEHTLSSNNSTL